MKWLIALYCLTLSVFAQNMTGEVQLLKGALASKNAETINQALLELNGAVNKYEFIDSSPWDHPSPDKQRRRLEIKGFLKPIEGDLVKLVVGDNATLASNSSVILGFSSGEAQVYDALKDNVEKSTNNSVAASSLYSLYQLGLADESVRGAAVQRISDYQKESDRAVAFSLLNLGAVWPIPEAIPVIIDILKSNQPVGAKIVASNAASKLGPVGAPALPFLEAFLNDLEKQNGDFRDINTLNRAISSIAVQVAADRNNKTKSEIQTVPPKLATQVDSTSDSLILPSEKPSESVPAQQVSTASTAKGISWWAIGGGFALVMAAAAWLIRFTKKSSK